MDLKVKIIRIFNHLTEIFLIRPYKKYKLVNYRLISYSQEGEDLILNRVFCGKPLGFYIDVGAHHPIRFSNTNFFYKMGWRGINIDAMPGSMLFFQKHRPRDINLEIPIGLSESEIEYYIFNDPALNGFSRELSLKRDSDSGIFKIKDIVKLKTQRLDKILDKYIPPNQTIDFMSVDVEGLDLEVLKSSNWEKYRPELVLVEILSDNLDKISEDPVYIFLLSQGYKLYSKAVNTCFFKKIK